MDWNCYEENLKNSLVNWFSEIEEIQNKQYDDENLLFELNKNTIDSFSAIVDVFSSRSTFDKWLENEKTRQKQKSLQGKIGDLHEIMIITLSDTIQKKQKDNEGYTIFDLYDETNKWIAEVKNKHNTTKGDDRSNSFDKLNECLKMNCYSCFTAYYVTILRDKRAFINEEFRPSDNTKKNKMYNPKIIHIDGESFYTKITGEEDALEKAYLTLSKLLQERFEFEEDEYSRKMVKTLKDFSLYKFKVNINKPSKVTLMSLNGIGESMANAIIEYHKKEAFEKKEDLMKVHGIGKRKYEQFKNFITTDNIE
jgi:competence ComEA-like helix-hairpin-helix protein